MSMNDPIADMLTRIRNANLRRHKEVNIPFSNIKGNIAQILLDEGFISSVGKSEDGTSLELGLKYYENDNSPVIRKIQRVSKPGLRKYSGYSELRPVMNGQGVYIVSTSKGIISDNRCRFEKIGGEVLCMVY